MGNKNIVINGKPYQNVSNIKVRDVNGQDMHDFRNTDDATIESKDIPVGKVGYGKDGKVIGTAIQTSGDGEINFYDQYGAWLTSYRLSDLPLSALPEIPALEGAGADQYEFAWTMTLEEVNALTEEADIGVDVTAKEGSKTYIIPNEYGFGDHTYLYFNYEDEVGTFLVDWGDGKTTTVKTNSSAYQTADHNFISPSHNPIVIEKVSGGDCGLDYIETNVKEARFGISVKSWRGNFQTSYSLERLLFHNEFYFHRQTSKMFVQLFNIKSLNIPKSAKDISTEADYMVEQCFSLESIFFHNGVERTSVIANKATSLKKIVLPSSYKELTKGRFAIDSTSLKTIKLPKTPVKIAESNQIVDNCPALEKIINSGSLRCETLGNSCLVDCWALKEFEIPEGVKTIGTYSFRYNYALESVIIPASVEAIGSSAFNQCQSLKQIIMKGEVPPTLSGIGSGIGKNTILYVPKGSATAYATATNWSSFANGRIIEY